MKARKLTEAERLARHNAEMKFALANGCTVLEARTRMARQRWQEFQDEQEARFERVRRCGTSERPSTPREFAGEPAPQAQPQFWWQKL